MKKILFTVLAASSLLFAEAYQVNTLSTRQLGMAHTGAGLKLGAESMHFNPGALGFLEKTLDLSAGISFIMPEVEFYGANGKETPADKASTPFYFYAASNITPWFSAGLSFTSPYGNAAKWDKNWSNASLIQEISLSVFTLQPTVAFKPISQVSFGGGPTINFGSFSLSKSIIEKGAFDGLGSLATGMSSLAANSPYHAGLAQYASTFSEISKKYADSPVSLTLSGDADVGIGFHFGALYDIVPDKFALGVSYRSKVDMKVSKGKIEGTEDVNKLNAAIVGAKGILAEAPLPVPPFPAGDPLSVISVPPFDQGTFKASLPLPANLNVGLSLRPIEELLFALDVQWIGWGAYDSLIVNFNNVPGIPAGAADQHLPKKYENTFAVRFGVQYSIAEQLDMRWGLYFDETPVKDEYLNPETPSMNKLGATFGLSYTPIPDLSIEASFLYVTGFGREGYYVNPSNGGQYEVQAWVPSIGLKYAF